MKSHLYLRAYHAVVRLTFLQEIITYPLIISSSWHNSWNTFFICVFQFIFSWFSFAIIGCSSFLSFVCSLLNIQPLKTELPQDSAPPLLPSFVSSPGISTTWWWLKCVSSGWISWTPDSISNCPCDTSTCMSQGNLT